MKLLRPLIAIALVAGAASAQTPLECPGAASATSHCDVFHYHVQMYRPDTRGFAEVWGVNAYSSQSACERARDAAMKRNLAVVDFFKRVRNESQYEPDRFGACHCDLSLDKTNPKYLTDAQRSAQLRIAEEVRQRVRERLMDAGITTESELVRDVGPPPIGVSLAGGPKIVPMPQNAPVAAPVNVADLKLTRSVDTSKPAQASLDSPLVDITTPASAVTSAPVAAVAGDGGPESTESAADAAESFIGYETQRIQNVLKASSAITDDALKSKIYDACMQRIQLLSNLRGLIEGSGARSRLADFARNAKSEPERLIFVGKLFGDDVKMHWAPGDAKDVVLDARDVDANAENVLRDGGGKFDPQQRRRALYALLAHSQPTEQQQLWLSTIADGFLQ